MIRYLFMLAVVCSSSFCFGQKIHFADETNQWVLWTTYPIGHTGHGTTFTYSRYTSVRMIGGTSYNVLDNILYIREDTIAKMVYVRLIDSMMGAYDTADRVLYDYNLKAGDTMVVQQMYGVRTDKTWVEYLDSVKMGGLWYKVWHMGAIDGAYGGLVRYSVIEGIGSTNYSLFPLSKPGNMGTHNLRCFYNDSTQLPLDRPVPCYWSDNIYSYFQNNDVCWPQGVREIPAAANSVIVIPNPIDNTSRMVLPEGMRMGNIVIVNAIGQTVYRATFDNASELYIGDKPGTGGVYYYRVTDKTSGKSENGKFIK